MGSKSCCNKRIVSDQRVMSIAPLNDREIAKEEYSSSNDALLNVIEVKNNLLTNITLVEYINILEYYTDETDKIPFNPNGNLKIEFSPKDEFLNYIVSNEEFKRFLEFHIIKIDTISEIYGKAQKKLEIFVNFLMKVFEELKIKRNEHYNDKKEMETITKRILISFGILFCSSNIVGKVRLIFDIFKNEKGVLTPSEKFEEYLLSSFLISSYCMISARKNISSKENNIEELSNQQLIQCLSVCELKDCQALLNSFKEDFFDENEGGYNWIEFKEKFEKKDKGFQWILSTRGIRKKLEEHNV